MDVIKQLIASIPSKNEQLFTDLSDKAIEFYNDLEKGLLKNDKEAIDYYYPDNPNAKIYYGRLKKHLFEKLSHTYLLEGQKNRTTIQKAYFEIHRDYFIANELMARAKNKAAIFLAEKTIDKASKYHLYAIVADLCRKVLIQYGTVEYNNYKLKKYTALIQQARAIRNATEITEDLFRELALHIIQSKRPNKSVLNSFEEKLNQAGKLFQDHPTHTIGFYYYAIQCFYNEMQDDYYSTLHYCKEAINFLGEATAGRLFFFLHRQSNIQIRLGQFEAAKTTITNSLEILPNGGPNWHYTKVHEVILHFHSGNYQMAKDTLKLASKHKRELTSTLDEQYLILMAYANYFLPEEKPFRLGKFLNQVPIYSKDKRGHNSNILIIQILYLLKNGKHNDIIDKIESLKQYCWQHLRNDDTLRSGCFIKMLCQLPAGNFNKKNVGRRIATYYEKMTNLPKEQRRMDIDVEVVPYEVLWEEVLGMLDE